MTVEDRYKERYKAKNTPWDIGKADFNLIEVVDQVPVQPCSVLDIGCGTGDNSIWLARNGFDVCGTDVSKDALETAQRKAEEAGAVCRFLKIDFLNQSVEGAPFDFAFDRGCFHSFSSEDDRNRFARNVAAHLSDGSLWLSVIGNADEKRNRPGPPQRSAKDIVLAVEPYFELLSLTTSHFESVSSTPPRAWRCLLRKRSF